MCGNIGIDETSVKKGHQCIKVVRDLQSDSARHLKMALREVYAQTTQSDDKAIVTGALKSWVSWAKRSRLEPVKKLAKTIESHGMA